MRFSTQWEDFELLDSTDGEKLERWGDIILIRPDPQVIWKTPKGKIWEQAHARYHRSSSGGGEWVSKSLAKEQWSIEYNGLKFHIRPTNFKHTGLFPE